MNRNFESPIGPREEKIRETIKKSKEVYFSLEQELTYREFLWGQLKYTRKRWWVLQAALLLLAARLLPTIDDSFVQIRSLGVIGCLFVVLLIPELWRNKTWDSAQVEAACLYSLRQVYAARITLFGAADVVLLTFFCFGLGRMGFSPIAVISQFLLPATVTAGICFFLLCGRRNWSEAFSLSACLVWGGVWRLIVMNKTVYALVAPAVWLVLFGAALLFLAVEMVRAVHRTNVCWEANFA